MLKKFTDWLTWTPPGIAGPSSWLLLWLVRFVFVVTSIGIAVTILFYYHERIHPANATILGMAKPVFSFAVVMLICIAVIWSDMKTRNKQITTISAVFFGLLIGFLLSELFWQALQPIVSQYLAIPDPADALKTIPNIYLERLAHLFITMIACYVAVSLLL